MITGKNAIIVISLVIMLLFIAGCSKESAKEKITLIKSSSCGCCAGHAAALGKEGYDVEITTVQDMGPVKLKYDIPAGMESCHTAVVEGYVVEGHVPMEAVEKLLREKPDIKGIALPDMPSGSPGMPGTKKRTWVIYSINHDGSTSEFMRI